ncbi:MAG: hypothetical protein U0793_22405 [Gemmataceae bacterium]
MILDQLRLQLHPTKTRLVELGLGKEGLHVPGMLPARIRAFALQGAANYLFRWPSPRAMKAITTKIDLTEPRRSGWAWMKDIREVIRVLNPVLWLGRLLPDWQRVGKVQRGGQLRASTTARLLARLAASDAGNPMGVRSGRALAASPLRDRAWLYRLLGTIRYPGVAHAV